ncbi:MAG: PTS glucose transporter subunit IIA [Clostridia bacterium]|nr:PTS glucose transporter subunit IIA [Clostridia bacterium]
MLFGKKTVSLCAPCTGMSVPLSEIPDEAFAGGMLGDGFGVEPSEGHFCAPVGGHVESVAEAKHAYTILTDEGLDVLVHIGVDTVRLNGEGFVPRVSAGQYVKTGDVIADADLELIRKKGLPTTVAVLVTNPEKIENAEYRHGSVACGRDAVMSFRLTRKG